jgi:DNA-binding response OmpR family regulator
VVFAIDGKEGELRLREGGFDLVVLDLNLPKRPGMALLLSCVRATTPRRCSC